jgi:drug/metabolite transporter (DMT)-like permease
MQTECSEKGNAYAESTRVAIAVTVNPVTASLVGAMLLHEPLSWNLVGGIATVFAGIWIATTTGRRGEPATQRS